MPVEIAGFAQALARCLDFDSVEPAELEEALSEASELFEMSYTEPTADRPLIRSGAPFTHLVFVQHGIVVPWQYPHSELAAPFLIGEHELLMDAERWVATYSAITETTVVQIPVATMALVLDRIPRVRDRMHQLMTRRLSRFYWTSLATTGTPSSRVAAALVSRLALDGLDHGGDRTVNVKQKDLARLTTMSRSAVADGLAELIRLQAIALGDGRSRFTGVVLVPDVDRLKDAAFSEFRERQLRQLLDLNDDDKEARPDARS
ncbi:MAG: hypothetical protein R3C39_10815 [Dehalococcoidia bacterium]